MNSEIFSISIARDLRVNHGKLQKAWMLKASFILLGILTAHFISAQPTDPFEGITPNFNQKAPESKSYNLGDWGVAEQRGAATYTFAIDVPPGRNGMAPSLLLRYSSQSPQRGGIAVGWTLDGLASIQIDRSEGQEGIAVYKATLGGASGKLVEVDDVSPYPGKTFRIDQDPTFTRFVKLQVGEFDPGPRGWVALTPDGIKYYFEEGNLPTTFLETRWHITKQVDPFGNTIQYFWDPVQAGHAEGNGIQTIDINLNRIEFTSNESAGLQAHALIRINYAPLETSAGSKIPIGALLENNFGQSIGGQYLGARRLTSIQTFVRNLPAENWHLHKTIDLKYDQKALQGGFFDAPLRYINQILVSTYSPDGELIQFPPIKFTYKRQERNLNVQTTIANLGYPHHGTIEGATSSMMDLDADGIQDKVMAKEENGQCKLMWQRGRFANTFEEIKLWSLLPTASWGPEKRPRTGERCNLNGQVVYKLINNVAIKGLVSYHFLDYNGDGRIDLLTNIWTNGDHADFLPSPGVLMMDNNPLGEASPADIFNENGYYTPGGIWGNGDLSFSDIKTPIKPEKEQLQLVWHVYENTGNGFSPYSLKVKTPPITRGNFLPTLPPSVSDENLDEEVLPNTSIPLLADLDGDGFLDFIDIGAHPNLFDQNGEWDVYFGNGESKFGNKYKWKVPNINLSLKGRGYFIDERNKRHLKKSVVAGLEDINGDNLPDLVVQNANNQLQAYLNFGAGFRLKAIDLGLNTPLEEIQTDYTQVGGGGTVIEGKRAFRRRMVDVNHDGLADMLVFPASENDVSQFGTPKVHFNVGDHFLPAQSLPLNWIKAARLFRAQEGDWVLINDFTDGDGDGLPNLIQWTTGNTILWKDTNQLADVRTISSIDNGRGGLIEFFYAPSTVNELVQWEKDQGDHFLPYPMWVVSGVKVSAGFESPSLLTHYQYQDPVFYANQIRASANFLGFKKTITTTYNNDQANRQIKAFDYINGGDPKGLLVEHWAYQQIDGAFSPHEFQSISLKKESLFNGKVFFTHPDLTLTRTCTVGATEASCREQSVNIYRKKEKWEPWSYSNETINSPFPVSSVPVPGHLPASTSSPASINPTSGIEIDPGGPLVSTLPDKAYLYLLKEEQEGSGLTTGTLDRKTRYAYQVRYGQSNFPKKGDYRILKAETVLDGVQLNDQVLQFQAAGYTKIHYNIETGLPVQTDNWMSETRISSVKQAFDPATGNLLSITNPEQVVLGNLGKSTFFTYDDYKIHVSKTVNEAGHTVWTNFDLATGAKLEEVGPNSKMVNNLAVFEKQRWKVDGLGRILEHSISMDDSNTGYSLQPIAKNSYFDNELPNRLVQENLLDFYSSKWTSNIKTTDGLGRTLTETQLLSGSIYPTKRYSYDAAGNLATVETPDPRRDDGTNVHYTYRYDGLNRIVQFIKPDNTGIDVRYEGYDKILTERITDGSGGKSKAFYDVFGRLVGLDEFVNELNSAHTQYEYDANNQLTKVIDADTQITTLTHDWIGNRLQIQRGPKRPWNYHYDLNGNLLLKLSPMPDGADNSDYVTTYRYDELGRIVEKIPASKGMSVNQMQEMGIGPIRYHYDAGENGIGRLQKVELPFASIHYRYDAQGRAKEEQRNVNMNQGIALQVNQTVRRQYNALGLPTLVEWEDGQKWRTNYDERGLTASVEWFDPQAAIWKKVTAIQRSLEGYQRKRSTDYGQNRIYTYDLLGRPIEDKIFKSGTNGEEMIASRYYQYSQGGDLLAVNGMTNGQSVVASYTYDMLHRLKTADGPNGYSGAFTYSLTGNLETAEVNWNGSNQARNVKYHYGMIDPQAVDYLENVETGSKYAEFTYDASGCMTRRNTPLGDFELSWDGEDQLRQVKAPNGPEKYYYDHNGQRMLAVVPGSGTRFWFAESETHFDTLGTHQKRYLHLSDDGSTIARIEKGNHLELQYADILQNLMLAMGTNGQMSASFIYGPFGEVLDADGGEDHRRQFNGKENDLVSSLRYYGFRYYDPLTCQWISADPLYRYSPEGGISEPQRLNLYSFSLNNPLKYLDLNGKQPVQGSPGLKPIVETLKVLSSGDVKIRTQKLVGFHYSTQFQNVVHNNKITDHTVYLDYLLEDYFGTNMVGAQVRLNYSTDQQGVGNIYFAWENTERWGGWGASFSFELQPMVSSGNLSFVDLIVNYNTNRSLESWGFDWGVETGSYTYRIYSDGNIVLQNDASDEMNQWILYPIKKTP